MSATAVVHAHAAGEAGLFANSYLVEGQSGVVAVDAPFTVAEAWAYRARLDATGKPLVAVLVTHAHPDHVNGITILAEGLRDVPVLATAAVERTMREIDGPKRAYWGPIYGADYPPATTFPTRTVSDGEAVTFGGLTFRVRDFGPGESADESMWLLDGPAAAGPGGPVGGQHVAFIGDVAYHRVHGWLQEGRTGAWLAQLDRARRELAGYATLYQGHGYPAGIEMLDWQAAYLTTYRDAVVALAGGKPALTDAQKAELTRRMDAFLPNAPLLGWVAQGADGVAQELARVSAPAPSAAA